MWSRVQVQVYMGTFSVDLMAQGVIISPPDVNVNKREVTIPLHLNGELCIPVKFIKMIYKSVYIFCSVWQDDKHVINITKPAQQFMGHMC